MDTLDLRGSNPRPDNTKENMSGGGIDRRLLQD